MSVNCFKFHDLHGRTLVITGITQGIGKTLLAGFLDQGMKVVALSRGSEAMEAVRRSMNVGEDSLQLIECDLSDRGQVNRAVEAIMADGRPIDALLHNAAIDPRCAFDDSDDEFWYEVFQVNLFSAVALTRGLLPRLRLSSQGRILFTGSVVTDLGVSCLSAYVASKGALVSLTRSLAHELKATGITVNCVQPGAIQVEKENHSQEDDARLIEWQSVSRRLQPVDMLGLVSLLLSRAGGAMTAQVFTVDGGLTHPLADASVQRALAPVSVSRGL